MASQSRSLRIRITLLNQETIGRRKIEGEFNYSHGSARVREGDKVAWWSTQGPFALHFGHGSPFRVALISSNPPKRTEEGDRVWATDVLEVEDRGAPQGFHYIVAMCRKDPENPDLDKVFIDSCPVILDEC